MTYIERLLTNQGRANRRLGEEILRQKEARLKGALGWSLAGVTLAYVLVVAAVGAIAL